MKIVYGTTNAAKIAFMQKQTINLGIEILSLADVNAPKIHVEEHGNSPLENARIKALAYHKALQMPVFSADSVLYIDGLDDEHQPGINVRGIGDYMDDDMMIAHYSSLISNLGGRARARYKNAICLVDEKGKLHEYMGKDIWSEPFYLVDKPHKLRKKGFPLDSLSMDIDSGKYYLDLENDSKYLDYVGFKTFFKKSLSL